jgi:tetratricopeptide (TPR) repeat protein
MLAGSGCGGPAKAREARYLATGARYMEKRDFARAALEFKNAVQISPDSAEVNYRLGTAFLGTGDFPSAVAYLRKATELDPRHVGAQVQLARMMATSRDPKIAAEATERARAAYAAAPEDPSTLDVLAETEWNSSQPEAAERHLQQALEKLPGHLKTAVMLAKLKLATKDVAGAEAILKKAVENNPGAPEPKIALGNIYNLMKRPAEAERQFQEALKVKPDFPHALLDLASLRVRAGQKSEAAELYKRIAALPDKTYRPAYALYLLYLVDAGQGVAELERLHQADPANGDIRTRLTGAYLERNRPADAQRILDAELKRDPKDLAALLQRGQLFVMLQRDKDAERDLSAVIQSDPSSAQAHLFLARVFGLRGEALRQRQELADAVRLDPQLLVARLALADQLLRANTAQGALEVLSQAPDWQQKRLEYVASRNWALLSSGDTAGARKGIDEGLAAAKLPEFLVQDARLKFLQRNLAGGRTSLEAVLKQNPEHLGALQMMMESYAANRETAAGLAKVRGYVAQRPSSVPLRLFLASWLRRTGDYKGARAAASAAKTAAPGTVSADLMLAELDLLEGRTDEARRRLATLREGWRSKPEAEMLSAMMEQQVGNYAAAIQHYRAIVAASPDSVAALNNLAYLLVEHFNRPDEGLQYAQKVKELAPNDPRVEDTIGWAFFRKGLYPTAVGHLESAVTRSNQEAATRYHLAMAYFKAGNPQKAQQTLDAALRIDPRVPEARMARELMSSQPGRAQ